MASDTGRSRIHHRLVKPLRSIAGASCTKVPPTTVRRRSCRFTVNSCTRACLSDRLNALRSPSATRHCSSGPGVLRSACLPRLPAQAVALAMQARAQRVRAGLPGQPGLHRQPAAVQAAVIGMQAGAALQRAIGRPGPARAGAQHGVGIAAPDAIGRQWQHLVAVCGHHHAGQASGAVDVAVVAQRGFHVGPAAAGGRRAGAMGAPWLCGSGASACRAWARWRASRAPRASPAAAAARASCCQCATWRGCTTTRRRSACTARCGSPQARAARASSKAHAQRRAGGWAVARVLGT